MIQKTKRLSGDNTYRLDEKDLAIIRLLTEDGRMSVLQISKKIPLTDKCVSSRISRMKKAGVIRGFCVDIDWSKVDEGRQKDDDGN